MTQYPEELKSRIITKMLPPENVPVSQLSSETGIPKDTLYTWRAKHRKADGSGSTRPTTTQGLSGEEKFTIVLECASLNEVELSQYCRRKGLYPQQIDAWRTACMQANTAAMPKVDSARMKEQSKHIKQLEAELRRKEKALAEAAALTL